MAIVVSARQPMVAIADIFIVPPCGVELIVPQSIKK
jgi:hypothetical protein